MSDLSLYEKDSHTFDCSECGWAGLGSELAVGELFEDLVEFNCPDCHKKITYFLHPNRAEAEAAAATGHPAAIEALARFDRMDRFHEQVMGSRKTEPAAPPELDDGELHAALELDRVDDHVWLVLTVNGIEIHRELAHFEDPEPASRLLGILRERYGTRLRSFDWGSAVLYLCGDRSRYLDDLQRLTADLPEQSGRRSDAGRTD